MSKFSLKSRWARPFSLTVSLFLFSNCTSTARRWGGGSDLETSTDGGLSSARDSQVANDASSSVADGATRVDAEVRVGDAGPHNTDAGSLALFGEACEEHTDCESGWCSGEQGCTRECSRDVPNDCRDVNRLCIPVDEDLAACWGAEVVTGRDADDANLTIGDCVMRSIRPLGDADIFNIVADYSGSITVTVTPINGSLDLGLVVYNSAAELLADTNFYGEGFGETQAFIDWATYDVFVVVADQGSSVVGDYSICVTRS